MIRFMTGYWTSVLLSVLLHEAAHLVTAAYFNVKVSRVGVNCKGAYIVREPGTPVQNTLISLAGPGINLVLFLLTYRVALTFALVNSFLGLCNLLPFLPASDGQRVYRLWAHRPVASSTASL